MIVKWLFTTFEKNGTMGSFVEAIPVVKKTNRPYWIQPMKGMPKKVHLRLEETRIHQKHQ